MKKIRKMGIVLLSLICFVFAWVSFASCSIIIGSKTSSSQNSGTSDTETGKPSTSDTETGKPSTSDTETGKPSTSDTETGKPSTSDTETGKPSTSDTETGRPSTSDTETSDDDENKVASFDGYTYASGTTVNGEENEILTGVTVILTASDGTVYTTVSDEEGYYSFNDVEQNHYTVQFTLDGYNVLEYELELNADYENNNIFMDLNQNSVLTGKVTVADYDTNYANNIALSGAVVTIVKLSGTSPFSAVVTTASDGLYSFDSLTSGLYEISVEKDGYIVLKQYITVEQGTTSVSNSIYEVIEDIQSDEAGVSSGMIYDAAKQGNVGIEGLTLTIRSGLNNTMGEVLLTLTTETNGSYSISGLPSGNYTVFVSDNRSLENEDLRYSDSYFNIKLIEGHAISNQNSSVSNGVFFGQIRIVLEWGSTPSDLDSHLTGPGTGTGSFHVYYSNKTYSSNGTTYVNLDRDDTDSYGPETTTIYEEIDGVYRFSVHDYSNQSQSNSTGIATSGATVKVYFGDTLKYTFYAPNEAGTLWTVFEYDSSTGILTAINTMSNQSNSSAVQ